MKIKLTFWRSVFLVIMAMGLYSTFVRYFRGLGAVSNMTDQFPWGFWIGFDGWNNGSVEQGGTSAYCSGGRATYDVWWEMYPYNDVQTSFAISAGDSMSTFLRR